MIDYGMMFPSECWGREERGEGCVTTTVTGRDTSEEAAAEVQEAFRADKKKSGGGLVVHL